MCGTDVESMALFTMDWFVCTMSVFPLFAVRFGFSFEPVDSFDTSCEFEAGSSITEADGLIKHGEWSFLALTGSELGNSDTVFGPVVDGSAVAASVTEVVSVAVA